MGSLLVKRYGLGIKKTGKNPHYKEKFRPGEIKIYKGIAFQIKFLVIFGSLFEVLKRGSFFKLV